MVNHAARTSTELSSQNLNYQLADGARAARPVKNLSTGRRASRWMEG